MAKKYSIGEIVYLITDDDQKPRQITGILERLFGNIYYLSNDVNETTHFDIEFSKDINVLLKLN